MSTPSKSKRPPKITVLPGEVIHHQTQTYPATPVSGELPTIHPITASLLGIVEVPAAGEADTANH